MSNELRFQRIEDKVDVIKQDVSEIRSDMKVHLSKVEEHITGDKKIIDELRPVLAKLPQIVEMAEEHHFAKQLKLKAMKIIGGIAILAGIAASISRIL